MADAWICCGEALKREELAGLISPQVLNLLGTIKFVWREGNLEPYQEGYIPGVGEEDSYIEEAILVGQLGTLQCRFYGPACALALILEEKPGVLEGWNGGWDIEWTALRATKKLDLPLWGEKDDTRDDLYREGRIVPSINYRQFMDSKPERGQDMAALVTQRYIVDVDAPQAPDVSGPIEVLRLLGIQPWPPAEEKTEEVVSEQIEEMEVSA